MWISVFAVTIAISIGCVVTAIVIESRESREDVCAFLSPLSFAECLVEQKVCSPPLLSPSCSE